MFDCAICVLCDRPAVPRMYPFSVDVCEPCWVTIEMLLLHPLSVRLGFPPLCERVAHYLAQHARRQRLGFLWCMLLGRGSPFRRLTYFHNGMAGNISEAEDVFDRLLSFL